MYVPPLLTCESVLAEACYLMPRADRPAAEPLELVTRGVVQVVSEFNENAAEVMALMTQYRNFPMSLADVSDCTVLTLDSDFRVYRRHRWQKIPVRIPNGL